MCVWKKIVVVVLVVGGFTDQNSIAGQTGLCGRGHKIVIASPREEVVVEGPAEESWVSRNHSVPVQKGPEAPEAEEPAGEGAARAAVEILARMKSQAVNASAVLGRSARNHPCVGVVE